MSAGKTATMNAIYNPHALAKRVAYLWDNLNRQRAGWLAEKRELRDYLFATDTRTTSNQHLPWKNSTTIPKLCQIRDNLHANYASALMPSDYWFDWEGSDEDSVMKHKREAIVAYMHNKVSFGGFRTELMKLLYDYIDYGNAFYDIDYYMKSTVLEDGEVVPGFRGAKLRRISPEDIVFNAAANSFDDTYKIVRSIKTIGDLLKEQQSADMAWATQESIDTLKSNRAAISRYTIDDLSKFNSFTVDGFGSMYEYFTSGYVEILEFEGSLYDEETGEYYADHRVIVADRSIILHNKPIESWTGQSMKGHVGWRMRPDNLYAMGPLDNLVGMQYRIDHLENAKADAHDLAIQPPLFITGDVDDVVWKPGAEIYGRAGASITELGKSLAAIVQTNNDIQMLEQKMEEMAGAPKQAMGVRTPGEKTAFEVQTLELAASRIFQNKIQHFEVELVEPALNKMFELSRRKMDSFDLIRVMDTATGAADFMQITKDDVTASGKLRAIGARHFAINATLMQNLAQLNNSGLTADALVQNHISPKAVAKLVEHLLGVGRFGIFQENARIHEQIEAELVTQNAMQAAQEVMATPLIPEPPLENAQ
jgi:hypothetical protein